MEKYVHRRRYIEGNLQTEIRTGIDTGICRWAGWPIASVGGAI